MKFKGVWGAGLAAVLFTSVLHFISPRFLQIFDRQTHDVLVRRLAHPPRSDAVVIADVDDRSLAELGQWPWPRVLHARLLEQLWSNGARVVAFDVLFSEPDHSSPEQIATTWSGIAGTPVTLPPLPAALSDFDGQFGRALHRGSSILATFILPDPPEGQPEEPVSLGGFYELGIPAREFLPGGSDLLLPLDVLRTQAAGVASINTIPDPDHVIRRTPLIFFIEPDRLVASLAMEAIRLYQHAGALGLLYDREKAMGLKAIRAGSLTVPTDLNGRVALNWRSQSFPTISAVDVLDRNFDPGVFSNKIVFIGASAAGLNDLVTTPVSANFPGVEVHATAVDNILAGDMLTEPSGLFYIQLAIVMLTGLLTTLLAGRLRPSRSLIAALALAFTVIGLSVWALLSFHRILSPATALLSILLAYSAATVVRYDQERRGRQRVRSMFSTMVSDQVLRYMENRPDSFSLVGRRTEVTVAFSDLADFTSIAERLEPTRLSDMLNRYLTPMAEIVLAQKGFVNKFNGDAIMSVWNVPMEVPDHAVRACLACLDQYDRLAGMREELSRDFGCELHMRMGINSGEVTAGNMGSSRRFEYTVMGDTVNAASRFESAGKIYHVNRVIGESTFLAAREYIEVRKLDRLVVKGKSRPIWIYELLARRGELDPDRERVVRLYEQAFEHHLHREWEEAKARLQEALRPAGTDGPCQLLLKRIAAYRITPPPPDWDGAFRMTEK